MQVTGVIARTPIVKEKVIFTSLKEENSPPLQVVLFRLDRPAKLADLLSNAKLDDKFTISGRLEKNPFNDEMQIIVDDVIALGDLHHAEVPNEF